MNTLRLNVTPARRVTDASLSRKQAVSTATCGLIARCSVAICHSTPQAYIHSSTPILGQRSASGHREHLGTLAEHTRAAKSMSAQLNSAGSFGSITLLRICFIGG